MSFHTARNLFPLSLTISSWSKLFYVTSGMNISNFFHWFINHERYGVHVPFDEIDKTNNKPPARGNKPLSLVFHFFSLRYHHCECWWHWTTVCGGLEAKNCLINEHGNKKKVRSVPASDEKRGRGETSFNKLSNYPRPQISSKVDWNPPNWTLLTSVCDNLTQFSALTILERGFFTEKIPVHVQRPSIKCLEQGKFSPLGLAQTFSIFAS